MEKPQFFELEVAPTPRVRDGFSLDTLVLEEQMKRNNNGLDLAEVDPHTPIDEDMCKRFVPCFRRESFRYGNTDAEKDIKEVIEQYPTINSPCAMMVNSANELAAHMSAVYQVAHFHYILGKKHNIKGSFPDWCCGISAENLFLSLLKLGYPNASFVHSRQYDHCYTILPFVHRNGKTRGSVVVDPTHDQMWDNPASRNAVFLKMKERWEYRTDWAHGADLFPDGVFALDILKKSKSHYYGSNEFHQDCQEYLLQAFENPITIPNANTPRARAPRVHARGSNG